MLSTQACVVPVPEPFMVLGKALQQRVSVINQIPEPTQNAKRYDLIEHS